MKRGCFIKSVVVITILVAVFIYILEYKIDEWVIEPGKKLILSKIVENWESETAYIKESVEKDSLKSLIKNYQEYIKSNKEVVNLDTDILLNQLENIIKDSIVTDIEISQLTTVLNKAKNEKSTIN